jgi:hypothetical protein
VDDAVGDSCVLMFSGGRDSSLAALRLAGAFETLTLITVTSEHLVGIEAVHTRLDELREKIKSVEWLHVLQPRFSTLDGEDHSTCLPCHLAYTAIGVRATLDSAGRNLAMGYAGYQSGWPEQTPEAVSLLGAELGKIGIDLHLPVYSIASREEACFELSKSGLDEKALEQKCLLQKMHRALGRDELTALLGLWSHALGRAFRKPPPVTVVDRRRW